MSYSRLVLLVLVAMVAGCSAPTENPEPEAELPMDELYFSRTAPWSRLGENIVAHDSKSPQAPRMVTMEPWHEMVFLAADGEHTVGQFVEHMGSQYEGGAPPGLREQIHEIVNALIDETLLKLHEEPAPLPPYIAEEHSEESPETRRRQMEEDGYIEPEK